MKATGIVRRIDELGRIVIPKEIRKTLRLREGDPLEIYTDKNELLFKKYSPIGSLDTFAEDIAVSLYEATEKTVAVCDFDEILFAKGSGSRDLEKRRLTKELEKCILDRKCIVNNVIDGSTIFNIVEGATFEVFGQLIVPIISGGDALGAIIILSKQKDNKISVDEIKLAQFSATFLAKQFS